MKADRTLEKIRYINELKAAGLLIDKNADEPAFVRGAEYYASKPTKYAISYKDINQTDKTP